MHLIILSPARHIVSIDYMIGDVSRGRVPNKMNKELISGGESLLDLSMKKLTENAGSAPTARRASVSSTRR